MISLLFPESLGCEDKEVVPPLVPRRRLNSSPVLRDPGGPVAHLPGSVVSGLGAEQGPVWVLRHRHPSHLHQDHPLRDAVVEPQVVCGRPDPRRGLVADVPVSASSVPVG